MAEIILAEIFEQVQQVYRLFDEGKLNDAKALTLKIEGMQTNYENDSEKALCRKYTAPCLIDVGNATGDVAMVKRGTIYLREWVDTYASEDDLAHGLYNLANGYSCSWTIDAGKLIADAKDDEEHRLARHYYRQSIAKLQYKHYTNGLACQVWTNYGNLLDSAGRSIEAIDAFDVALKINPNMGMALGNKGIAITHLAPIMHGHTHLFYLESLFLLKKALEQPLTPEAGATFTRKLEQLKGILKDHGEMRPEEVKSLQPTSAFHHFLCEFCSKHGLFLNPVTFLGTGKRSNYGDPMFIARMYAPIEDKNKFDRYVTYLNEIKQDFVLGRYMLVQSQYESDEIDAIDEGVSLFYPLDYSLHSSYVQLLKTAMRLGIAVLDKVAYFIYDYCKLNTPQPERIDFRNIWGNDKMRGDLAKFASPHLFALFGLANDVSKKRDWSTIYDHRHALTHRFLVVHDFQRFDQNNDDIPRVNLDEFLNDVIRTFKIARAAITYLILFVEYQEHVESQKNNGITPKIYATPVDSVFRYRPR